MRLLQNIFVIIGAMLFCVYSCKKSSHNLGVVPAEVKSQYLNVVVDNSFLEYQKAIIKSMFEKYDSMVFSSEFELYRKFFGGDGREYLDNFMNQRLKYFVPIDERVLEDNFGDLTKAIGAGYATTWLNTICHPEQSVDYVICNGSYIKIDTPRHGVVIPGPAFFDSQTTDIERISVLAHESRHADCHQRPSVSDACTLLVSPDILDIEEFRCGHVHAKCSNSDQARSCDNITWGSYAVSFAVLGKIYKDCLNCSEEDKQLALVLAKGYSKRFLADPFSGEPDLSSYDE